ncbi:MAG: choice-of-anchor J domain-containing protein [Clostridium sp.]|nr:choice-of-anchor J domain-containing protein [Prevotella sp.]MCM1429633.1 choice-of-anchor J domain-containing protein [Clostridium sp.]MCM1474683.1 choice-of-anchor J domain-containing protein [Muribaculaceae bacterium]
MKRRLLIAAAGMAAVGSLYVVAQDAQQKWSRMPNRPHSETEAASVVDFRKQKDEPNFQAIERQNGRAEFEGETGLIPLGNSVSGSTLAERMLRSPQKRATRTAETLIGDIYGVCNNFDGMGSSEQSYSRSFWGKINFEDFTAEPLYYGIDFCNTMDQANQTGAVRDGILYIPEGQRSSVRDFEVVWKRFDIEQGKWLEPLRCGDNLSLWMLSMCYDPITDAFYGMAGLDDNGSTRYGRIVRIDLDPVTGLPKETVLRDLSATAGAFSGFLYDPKEERILVFTDHDYHLSEFNRKDGTLIEVCELYCPEVSDENIVFTGFDNRGTAHLVYSPKDDKILIMCVEPGSTMRTYVFALDTDTGEITRQGEIKGGYYMTTLYTPNAYAEPDAAGPVELKKINLEGNSSSGSLDILLPTTLYNGLELSTDVTLSVTADGKSIYSQSAKPGTTVNVPFTLEEGLHKIVIRANIGSKEGPALTTKIFVGNDTPVRPTNLTLNETTLTWTAPGAVGFNNGYVDVTDLTYDVYFNGNKINTAPISATTYTFTMPAELERVDITVTATAKGKTSLASEPINVVIGNALTLPYTATPEASQAALFTIIDSNHDGSSFAYDTSTKEIIQEYENYQGSNDWLILPAIAINDPEKMYEFRFDFRTFTPYYGTETIEICIGTDATAQSMRSLITYPNIQTGDSKRIPLTARFNVERAGVYYLAIHPKTTSEGAGSRISNLSVTALNSTTGVAATPVVKEVVPGAEGALWADLKVEIPTKDVAGRNLAQKEVTVKVANFDGNAANVGEGKGLPGSVVTVRCPGTQGFNTFLTTLVNEIGESASTTDRAYIGIDIPKIVTNFTHVTAKDNMSMYLSWDPVTEGINGGFIDPENLEYQVWYNPQGVTWNKVGDPIKGTEVKFNAMMDDLYTYKVSVFAQNSAGFKKAMSVDYTVSEVLGVPLQLPVKEPFGTAGPTYRWSYNRSTPETENSQIRQILNDELRLLGIGNPSMEDGSGRLVGAWTPGTATKAELIVPKFATKGQINPTFRMRYWAHGSAPVFTVTARKYGQEEPKEIFKWAPQFGNLNVWEDITFAIPEEYADEEWVQFRINFDITRATNCYGIIDGIDIFSNVDVDMKTSAISAEPISHVGEDCTFEVSFLNAGQERARGSFLCEVIGDGNVIDSETVTPRGNINSLSTYKQRFVLNAKTEYLQYKDLKVRFTANIDGDQIPSNNSMEINWEILESILPVVTDLSGFLDKDDFVNLNWTAPEHPFGAFDDFEFCKAFEYGEKMGQWTNLNRDKLQNYTIGQLTDVWVDCGVKKAWQVVNDEALGTVGDPSLGAHSGHQFLVATAGYDPDVQGQFQVSDWLISPEVVGGTTVKFWMNILDATYRETLHIYYSTTDNKPESFIKLCNRSKEGTTGWEQTSFTLPADAKYFAMVYVGWDTLGVCIDDLEYTPANPDMWGIDSFDIYRMCPENGDTEYAKVNNVKGTHAASPWQGKETYYFVKCKASYNGIIGEGPASNIFLADTSGVHAVETLGGIAGGHGEVIINGHSSETANIFDMDGKRVATFNVASDSERHGLDAGVYIIMIGKKAAKVIVR